MDKAIFSEKNYQRDNFIRFLFEGKREITNEEINIRKEVLGLDWLSGPFVVAMVAPVYSSVCHADKDAVLVEYEQYVDKILDELPVAHYTLLNSYNNIVVLLAFDGQPIVSEQNNQFFIDMNNTLVKRFSLEVFIGIGNIVEDYKGIADSVSNAQEMLSYKFQYADSGVVNIATLVQFEYNISRGNGIEIDRVIGCFKDGNLGKMEIRLNELVESVRHKPNVSGTSIRRSLVEVTVHLLHAASNAGVDVDEVLEGTDPYRWIMRQNHTEVITEWIMKTSSRLLELIQNIRENEEKTVIQQAKSFIEENLSSIDLGLQQVSNAVGLSSTYCSQLFKREVGMGINTFITQLRIERAQTLLCDTDLSSSDISKQIGFMSAGYFSQVFRKITGFTPQEYRHAIIKK